MNIGYSDEDTMAKTEDGAAHSILPPSSASIWRYCTGWVSMAQQIPQQETEHTLRGTAIHEVGALMIESDIRNGIGHTLKVGDTASNGTVVAEDMFECAWLWAHTFGQEYRSRLYNGFRYGIEQQVQCPRIHPENFGTPDSWLYDPKERVLVIDDCKGGHVHVDAFENWQLINYASGVADHLGLRDDDTQVWLRIIQPFSYHSDGPVRTWKTTIGKLKPYWKALEHAAHRSMGDTPELVTGHQCRRCQVRHACPAALDAGLVLYETSMTPVVGQLPPAALGLQMQIVDRAMEQLKALKTGYEEQVKATIKGGTVVPGWCLQPTAGREKWRKSQAEIVAMGQLFGVDLKKDDLVTPNQARKAGVPNEVLSVYSGRETGLELKPESTDKARMIFEGGA